MRLLAMKQVCYLIGVSRATLYRWLNAGLFVKPIKPNALRGGRVFFRECDVLAWIESH